MPTTGELVARYRRAVVAEDVAAAISAAGEMPYVGLGDSLDLVRLLARKADPRFDRAANRWLSRFVAEKGASVGELQVATAAMGALAIDPDAEHAVRALHLVIKPEP